MKRLASARRARQTRSLLLPNGSTRATLARWVLVALAVGLASEALGLFEFAELRTYDIRVAQRAERAAAASPALTVVAIDDKSEDVLGPFPWPHAVYASLVARLREASCRGVLFSLVFNREEPGQRTWRTHGLPVYLIRPYLTPYSSARGRLPSVWNWHVLPSEFSSPDVVSSFSVLQSNREDGVYRSSQAVVRDGVTGRTVYSLEMRFAADILGVTPEEVAVPHDREGRVYLPRGKTDLATVSFADVLSGDIEEMRRTFGGTWAIVGASASPNVSVLQTPFGTQTALDLRAAAVNAMVVGEVVLPRTRTGVAAAFAGWAVVLSIAAVWAGTRRSPPTWAVVAAGGAAVLVHVSVSVAVFQWAGLWLPIVSPSVFLGATTLACAFAANAARLRLAQRRALRAEREAAFGVMSAQVRHELRNLLNSIRAPADMVRRNFARGDPLRMRDHPEAICAEMDTIVERVMKLSDMVENELSFLSPSSFRLEEGDLWEVARSALDLVRRDIESAGIVVRTDAPAERARVRIDADKMRVVFVNLVRNAMQAMPEGGILTVAYEATQRRFRPPSVLVRVQDTGVGMDSEQQAHLFEPFYTTKARGLGLGLLNARNIVEAHGGEIRVRSRKGEGAVFEVVLRCSDGGPRTAADAHPRGG
jgi:signal transduction histidine kinase